jgi:prophage antirepressor-like protein
MANHFIDIYNHILNYEKSEIYIAFDDEFGESYFNAKQTCELLGYTKYKDALRKNVEKKDIYKLKDIVKNYKSLYKNVQGHANFLSEIGLYSLILLSRKTKNKEIFNWIVRDVMPHLRKYGKYEINDKYKEKMESINNQIDDYKGKNIYILRTIETDMNFNIRIKYYFKVGRTKKMEARINVYNTTTKNKVQVIKTIPVENLKVTEGIIFTKLEQYRIQDKKEYFECSYKKLIKIIAECVYFIEGKTIDTTPNIAKYSRKINSVATIKEKMDTIDIDKDIIIKVINDADFDSLLGDKQPQKGGHVYNDSTNKNSTIDAAINMLCTLQENNNRLEKLLLIHKLKYYEYNSQFLMKK